MTPSPEDLATQYAQMSETELMELARSYDGLLEIAQVALREEFARRIEADPRNYIAQPTITFSRAPCLIEDGLEPRHVDLRPYVLYGDKVTIVPGGLTRVALQRGSLVVNSSQVCGSKDTWVLSQ